MQLHKDRGDTGDSEGVPPPTRTDYGTSNYRNIQEYSYHKACLSLLNDRKPSVCFQQPYPQCGSPPVQSLVRL